MPPGSDDILQTLARAPRRRFPRGLWWLGALVLALAGGGLWSLGGSGDQIRYVTEAVQRGDLTVSVTATGSVQPTKQVEISSELSGTLAEVSADFNDRVEVGQVLARLDTTKLSALVSNAEAALVAARARVTQAEATAQEAQLAADTATELDRKGLTTHQALVSAQAVLNRALAAVEIARADARLADSNLTLGRADLAKAEIRSPIKGVVLDRKAETGQIIAASLSAPRLFLLAEDLARMELQVDIDEADIGKVQLGNPASFTVDAHPGMVFPASLTSVRYAPETTEGVVTYKAVLTVDNARLLLRPGMTATATITVSSHPQALLVPNAALRYAPPQVATTTRSSGSGLLGLLMPRRPAEPAAPKTAGRSLWVLRDGVAQAVPVEIGETDGRNSVLVSGDLAEGDQVITDQGSAP